MAELRDTMLLDLSQPLAEVDKLEAKFDKLFAPRALPVTLPSAPRQAPASPTQSRPERRAEDAALERLSNRLRVVQQELKRLGDGATDQQLEVLERRLQRLTVQAELLAPGMDKGGKGAVKLSGILTGLVGTSADVQAALGRVGQAQGLGNGVATIDSQIKSLGKTVGTLRGLWQTQILTDEQAGQSAMKLRDQLLKLAASDKASADAVLKATQAAAAAQRVLDSSRSEATKGGFAFNAGIGILDALARVSGPVGAAAFGVGTLINSGLLSGMNIGKPRVGKGAQDIGSTVIDALKNRLQIRSPSRITTQFGVDLATGLALGMKANTAQVARAGAALGASAQTGIQAGLGSISGTKLSQSLGGAQGALSGLGTQALNGANQMSRLALSASQVAFVAGAATTALIGLGVGIAGVIKSGAALEEQLFNIKALTQPTAEELTQLKEAALNLGTDLGVGPRDAAAAILELNKAGLSASEAIGGGLAGALNLAGAAGIEAGEGANIAVNAMTAFGLQAKDLPKVADVFANFANKTTQGAQDLSVFISALGPAAKDAGLTIEQVAGYAATLSQGGFKNMQDAGTSFKTFLTSLQSPSETAKRALKTLESSLYDATGAARPVGEVLEEVRQKLSRLSEQQRNARLYELFGSDAGRAARVFFGTTNKAIEENITAMGLQGEAARVARERLGSYAGQVKVLKAEWETFTATIGLIFLPALTNIVKGIRGVIDWTGNMMNRLGELKRFLPSLAIALTGVGLAYVYVRQQAIAAVVVNIWSGLPALAGAARVSILAVGNAIKTTYIPAIVAAAKATLAFVLANPWLLVIVGVTAAAAAIQYHFQEINNTYAQMDAASNSSFEKTMERVRALRQEGGELNNTQASYLLALERLKSAQTGMVTGVNLLTGEQKVTVDPAEVARAEAEVKRYRAELERLRTEQGRRPPGSTNKPLNIDPKEVEKQTNALKDLRQTLSDKAFEVRISGLPELSQQLEQLGREFDGLRLKIKTAFNFDANNPQLRAALGELDAERARQVTALLDKSLKDQRKLRTDHERAVRSAEAAASQDSLAQRRNELNTQIADLKTTYSKEIKDALQNGQNKSLSSGDRQKFIAEAGRLQQLQNREVLALERQRDQELDRMSQERLEKVRAAQRETLDVQAKTIGASIAQLEGQRDRELQMAGDVPAERLKIEQRYGPELARLREAQQGLVGQSERAALLATYNQQLRDAKTAGAQRGALERSARETYLEGLREIEVRQQTETAAEVLAQEERVQKERLAIYQKGLGERLDHLKDATGQEIAALERTLGAERARAALASDGGKVAAIDEGLKKIADIKFDNVRDLRKELTDGVAALEGLRDKLANLNPNKDPRQTALSSAASPYNDIIKEAGKLQASRQEAFGKLTPQQQQAQLADYQRQQGAISALVLSANRQRNAALLTADQAFDRARNDRDEETHLKLSKRELDLGKLTIDGYQSVVEADRTYWETRAANAAAGSQDQQTALDKVREAEDELLRLENERRALRKDVAAFTREELQRSVELATTEQTRTAALERLTASDQGRRSALDAEIAALTIQGGHEKEILALKRERAEVQKTLVDRQREEVEHAAALRQSILGLVEAENALATKRARTDADVAQGRQASLELLQRRVGDVDTRLGDARSDQERNQLTAERLGLTGQILDLENEIAHAPLDVDRQRVDLGKAQAQLQLQRLGLAEDEVALGRQGVFDAQEQLRLAQAEQQFAARNQGPDQQRAAGLAVAQAELAFLQAQQALLEAPIRAEERRLTLFKAQSDERRVLAGLEGDEVAQAQQNLVVAREEQRLAQERLDIANGQVARDVASTDLAGKRVATLQAEQALREAPIRAEERRLTLFKAQADERRTLAGLGEDAVAKAQQELLVAREEQRLAEESLSIADSQVSREKASADLAGKRVASLGAERALQQALLADRDRYLNLVKEEAKAQAVLSGASRDSLDSKRLELEFTRLDLTETNRRLANADQLRLTDVEITDLRLKRVQLLGQEAEQQRDITRALLDQARLASELAEAATRSQLARSHFFDDGVALARVDLAATQEKLRLNQEELAQASALATSQTELMGLQRDRQALLAQEAEGVRKVAEAERQREVFRRSLRESLRDLQSAARDQSEQSAVERSATDVRRSLEQLQTAERDAAGFLSRLRESQVALNQLQGLGDLDDRLATGLRGIGDSAEDAAATVNQLDREVRRSAEGRLLSYHEAAEGKERIDALTSAITNHRQKLTAVADAYEQQVSGIESVIQATLKLNELTSGSANGQGFASQVNEIQRQQALAETNRLLNSQQATYAQISAAAGRLADAEQGRIAQERSLLNDLATKSQKGDSGATEELRQRLASLRYSGTEISKILAKVKKEGGSALSEVNLGISQGAQDLLDRLRDRALAKLGDVAQLRAQAFQARLEAAKEVEEYARLNNAVALADAGFTELEANQLAAIDRQERLNGIVGKSSVLGGDGIKRDEARAALDAENEALIKQVQLRKGIDTAAKVSRDDLAEQRRINAAFTDELSTQARLQEAALLPAQAKLELGEASAKALQRENDALAVQVSRRLGIGKSDVTRGQIEQQRRLNEEVEKYQVLMEAKVGSIAGKDPTRQYDASSPEVRSAVLLALAQEDAFYGDQKRLDRAIAFEKRKAVEVAKALASDDGVLKTQVGFETKKAEAVMKALAPLQQKADAERNEASVRSMQAALEKVKLPSLDDQATRVGRSAGEAMHRAIEAALLKPLILATPTLRAGTGELSSSVNNARTITIHKTVGPITVNAHTDANPADIARAVRDEFARVDREAEVYGECQV